MKEKHTISSPDPVRNFGSYRLGSLMLVIAGVAGVLAITPRPYFPIVAIFAGVATAAASVIRLASGARWLTAYSWVTALYPLYAIGMVYSCWFAAWYELGHMPRPSLDDPKDVEGIAAPAYRAAVIGLQGLFPAMIAGPPLAAMRLLAWGMERPRPKWAAAALMLGGLAAWAFLLGISMSGPSGVLMWFFD